MLKFLWEHGLEADITIADSRSREKLVKRIGNLPPIQARFSLGDAYDRDLDRYDIVFRVPGCPMHKKEIIKAQKNSVEITSVSKIFLQNPKTKNVIAVTGTKGKGTTSGLIVKILATAGKTVHWGGNIGVPIFSFYKEIKKDDFVVLELSSFQLEDVDVSPHIAVITNIFPEHLQPADPNNPNYHKSYQSYCNIKMKVLAYQRPGDYAVLNPDIKNQCMAKGKMKVNLGKANKIYFNKQEFASRLAGEYNKYNIGAAFEVGRILGIRDSVIKKAVKNFKSLPHRLEFVRELNGVKYFDNSFATTPESTIADIQSFAEDKIIILGGADKGADFNKLAEVIRHSNVKLSVILPGEGSTRILKELDSVKINKERVILVDDMEQAVRCAYENSRMGDVVILSTACASFGLFRNYYERGDKFREEVNGL